ncbi:MAG: mismatch-specific DNA-glycosylase [Coprothermobacter sp.]|jgi:TDG/mug DNA glycosylase family protein|nr:mismatch-specific DNA-glycosylase [Coprothermobacter sp.]
MKNRHGHSGSELEPAIDDRPAGELIPDVLTDGLRVVFCGSALGDVSWERRAYYANPGNHFWQTLAEVGLTPRRLAAEEYPRLLDWGIGLTDLVKTDHGQDAHIFDGHVDLNEARRLLRSKVLRWQPRVLAFTSRTVAAQFLGWRAVPGRQRECIGQTVLWVLPSTSGLARRFFDIALWQDLARFVRDPAGGAP